MSDDRTPYDTSPESLSYGNRSRDDNAGSVWSPRLGEVSHDPVDQTSSIPLAEEPTAWQASEPIRQSAAAPGEERSNEAPFGFVAEEEVVKKKKRWPWITAAAAVVLVGAYLGSAFYFQDKIPANTSVAGVAVGGMTSSQAREELSEKLADKLAATHEVTIAEEKDAIDPAKLDLAVDYAATFKPIVGFSLSPLDIWNHIAGGNNYDAVLNAHQDSMDAELSRLAKLFDKKPVDASLAIEGTKAVVKPAVEGSVVDKKAAQETILKNWFAAAPIMLPTTVEEPQLATEKLQEYADKSINPLLSGPISINVKDDLVELTPEQTASALEYKPSAGTPDFTVNPDVLTKIIADSDVKGLTAAKDAVIQIVNNKPTITESVTGEGVDAQKLAESLKALAGTNSRTVTAQMTSTEPELTTAKAQALGIKEIVSEISTPLTNDSVRTQNLLTGTKKINNTLVLPGQRFNLGEALGEVDAAHGYVSSGVVVNGFNSESMGGGLSQLSTNTFNIGYRAGMLDVAHQPHSKYFSRYPMGLESTLWGDQIQMIWENNTPYGVLIQAYVANGRVHTRLWSTKYWDVQIWQGKPYNYVQPEMKKNSAADCVPSQPGGSGFSVKVGRKVSHEGKVHENSSYTWTYQPVHGAICE